jgi:hypothetical protein
MASPIPLELPRTDPRLVLQARLENAPAAHVEALLAAYEVRVTRCLRSPSPPLNLRHRFAAFAIFFS